MDIKVRTLPAGRDKEENRRSTLLTEGEYGHSARARAGVH